MNDDRAVRSRRLVLAGRVHRVSSFVDVDRDPVRVDARLDRILVEVVIEKGDGQLDGAIPGRPPGPDPNLDRRVKLDVGAIGMEDGERTSGLRRVGIVVPRPGADDRMTGRLRCGVLGRCAAGRQGEAEPSDAETGEGGATGDGRDGRGSSGCWHRVEPPSCERRCSLVIGVAPRARVAPARQIRRQEAGTPASGVPVAVPPAAGSWSRMWRRDRVLERIRDEEGGARFPYVDGTVAPTVSSLVVVA